MRSDALNLNDIQNNSSGNITAKELLELHPTPWERRGRALFDKNGVRINLVDSMTLTGVIDLVEQYSKL